jgi:hypothetical protein
MDAPRTPCRQRASSPSVDFPFRRMQPDSARHCQTAFQPPGLALGHSDSVVLNDLPDVPAGQMAGLSMLGAFAMARSCRRAANETGAGSVVQNGVFWSGSGSPYGSGASTPSQTTV